MASRRLTRSRLHNRGVVPRPIFRLIPAVRHSRRDSKDFAIADRDDTDLRDGDYGHRRAPAPPGSVGAIGPRRLREPSRPSSRPDSVRPHDDPAESGRPGWPRRDPSWLQPTLHRAHQPRGGRSDRRLTCPLFGDLSRCGGSPERETHAAGPVLELAQDPDRTIGAFSLEVEPAPIEVWRSPRLGRRLGCKTGEQWSENTLRLSICGGCCIKSEILRFLLRLRGDRAEQLLRQPLDSPVWTQRGRKQVSEGVLSGHRGITRFSRLCHSARSSLSPLSGSNRISPPRARPAAIGSAWRISMIHTGTLTSRIAGPPSSGRAGPPPLQPSPVCRCRRAARRRSLSRSPLLAEGGVAVHSVESPSQVV